jgi:uncharacterized protein YbjQ (UPF0145 family)
MSLTNEDKQWIGGRFEESEQMTDGKLATLEAEIRAAKNETIEAMREIATAAKAETIEAVRDMQTEILKGIEAFARGNYARMHRLETSDTATNARIEALEQRVLMLETRQRPPQ